MSDEVATLRGRVHCLEFKKYIKSNVVAVLVRDCLKFFRVTRLFTPRSWSLGIAARVKRLAGL
jgi:hypothetical protein